MSGADEVLVLKNAHVIDPAQGVDRVVDVSLSGGKIQAIGGAMPAGARTIDLTGHYLTAGWVDLHVHAYGALGFGDPDSIGIYQGVTSFVDAGGTGIGTLDECMALTQDHLITSLYAGPYIYPMGIVGQSYVENESDVVGLEDLQIEPWLEWKALHPGFMRYVKVGAYGPQGRRPIEIAKGVARRLGLPLYLHIGETTDSGKPSPHEDGIAMMDAGDIVTHVYQGNVTGQVVDDDGKVLPVVWDALKRGVLFDIGFGGYNFSWKVAESAYAQGLVAPIISSDLQQFNVMRPCYSLANVMTICLRLGMSLHEVIAAVTVAPAKALSLLDRAGSLRPGLPADVTVFRMESGAFELLDTMAQKRKADRRIVPVLAFKDGRQIECDLARAQDERNWFLQIVDDRIPSRADTLSPDQLKFLADLSTGLAHLDFDWDTAERLDLRQAAALQALFNRARRAHGVGLKDALGAVYDSFLEHPLPMQMGLFLIRLDRPFAIQRLADVARRAAVAA